MKNTYIKSVSWCPVHQMHVVILVNREKTKWLPIFIKADDADVLESLLTGEKIHMPPIKGVVYQITLGTNRSNPYYATVTIKRGDQLVKKKMYYAAAIIIAARMKLPVHIPEEKMFDVQKDTSYKIVRREDVRTALKERLDRPAKPKSALERLESQLQDAIDSEEYEEAEIISKEIEILRDKYSK